MMQPTYASNIAMEQLDACYIQGAQYEMDLPSSLERSTLRFNQAAIVLKCYTRKMTKYPV